MRKYIGTKLVEAEPAWRLNGKVYEAGTMFGSADRPEEGCRVRCADGYESWSPKEVFEAAYLRVNPDGECKTGAPSVSPGMVEDFLRETWTETLGEKTTVVRAVLRNGFEIVESSSCVSPENYDEAMGRDICLEKIRDKVWELLGFLLQTAVNGIAGADSTVAQAPEAADPVGQVPGPWGAAPESEKKGVGFGEALEAMKAGKGVRLPKWSEDVVIRAQYPDEHSKMTAPYLYVESRFGRVPWKETMIELFSEDWEIVE